MKWDLGRPCAFTDQANVFAKGSPKPIYYELEVLTNLGSCQAFYLTEKGAKTTQAVDSRFVKLTQPGTLPNEYEIQHISGVLNTLNGMPSFRSYVVDPLHSKSALLYDLWGRPTLEFSPTCSRSIKEAVQILE